MKLRLLMLLSLFAGALLQQFLPAAPLLGNAKPPVLAALALHYALRREPRDMWLAAFAAALLHDALDLGAFGPGLVAFPVACGLANRIRNEVFPEGFVTQLVFGAALGLFTALAAAAFHAATGQRPLPLGQTLLRLFGSLGLGMATLPLASRTVAALEAFLPKRKGYGWQ